MAIPLQRDGLSHLETTSQDKLLAGPQPFAVDCSAMNGTPGTNGRVRILGVDPAAAGPTGYGIVERVGRTCNALRFGALRIAPNDQKESPGAALQKVHAL